MIANTSARAYEALQSALGAKQQVVYEAIKELGTATNDEISDHLHWRINCVTGRTNELNRYGVITLFGIGKSKAGNSAKVWCVKNLNDKQLMEIANEIERKKSTRKTSVIV